ncbi:MULTISPECIES: MBOAT family protein [unclassified Saccharibacter]|uniref:MBOAT family O-acyltransferase n=1 Tax=unclassified Saccharibacter TaxID=2648722 RepID=UPI00132C3601|nr:MULTISPECIES: MBOAT family protein [unclassified Saccharibacter]MXV35140.1 MBOAT family protein [Saccharibacter sp. EH611]MXV57313.1 MBOAT family protein [Saccharibacter sp. EH70]MXV64826.1 MBOAT family protein [Saccharibacter sp. EH60]
MNILSLEFFEFFSCFFVLYWILQPSLFLQNLLLLAGSLFFISWGSAYNFYILLAWTGCVYGITLFWRKTGRTTATNIILCVLIVTFFFLFRFYAALQESLKSFLDGIGLPIALPMVVGVAPLGLSFYVFHSVSYVISLQRTEVVKNRGAFPAHTINGNKENFFSFLLYTSFFPSIVSGPINRAVDLFPQLMPFQRRRILWPKQAVGLILLGLFKLFLVSDYLDKHLVSPVFSAPSNATPVASLTAVIAYAWQIYMNFSGYTDLVRGVGLLLGFHLPENFNAPYLAANISEFWRRWHITLSRFITDYIYIPLGGNRCGFARQNINVLIAMGLSGLWHGVGMNFFIWGMLHGAGLVVLNGFKHFKMFLTDEAKQSIPPRLAHEGARFVTFVFLCLTWVFFRSANFDDAITLLSSLTHCFSSELFDPHMLILWVLIAVTAFYGFLDRLKKRVWGYCERLPWWVYPFGIAALLTLIFMFAPAGTPGFIYANF